MGHRKHRQKRRKNGLVHCNRLNRHIASRDFVRSGGELSLGCYEVTVHFFWFFSHNMKAARQPCPVSVVLTLDHVWFLSALMREISSSMQEFHALKFRTEVKYFCWTSSHTRTLPNADRSMLISGRARRGMTPRYAWRSSNQVGR